MRLLYFFLICSLLVVFSYFCCDRQFDYEPSYYKHNLSKIREQLDILKVQLHKHKEKYGNYPSNDEGLLALDEIKPIYAEELRMLRYSKNCTYLIPLRPNYHEMIVSEAGVMSPWRVPFVYENRRGLDESLFEDSLANEDIERNYSVQIDDDVYIYSVGGMIFYHEYKSLIFQMFLGRFAAPFLALIFLILYIRETRKQKTEKKISHFFRHFIFVLANLGIWTVFFSQAIISCYIVDSLRLHRRADFIKTYNALLEKYRERGVIKGETYDKIKTAVDRDSKKLGY